MKLKTLASLLATGACLAALSATAQAGDFNVPAGDLKNALDTYVKQAGISLMYSGPAVKGIQSRGVKGALSTDDALSRILRGTGFVAREEQGGVVIVPEQRSEAAIQPMVLAQAAPHAAMETVTVTSSKLGGADVQSIPIAITALSQEQLTATQTAGGPDLVKQVPNLTFTKTNFSGYSIQIRGIGTQAISVTTDPAVAIALNDIPFIRNHFFEQEFFDLSQAEVLRGPQGMLYGRNATAGVVNLITAKPTDQFEAQLSGDIVNYKNRRFEGMINLPLVDDRLDLRVAGEWTKRNGYSTNDLTGNPIDGRNLWSGRMTVGWKPFEKVQTYLVWEHFQENDDRMRTAKQLCKTDPTPTEVGGVPINMDNTVLAYAAQPYLSQGCSPTSLYSADAFQVPNGVTLPYYEPLAFEGVPVRSTGVFDPYGTTVQSHDLRVIESASDPVYKAKNDTVELNVDFGIAPSLTFSSQTGYNQDFLWSTEDYNRFNTRPGAFRANGKLGTTTTEPGVGVDNATGENCTTPGVGSCDTVGIFCDPQLGCSDRLVAQDLNDERSWQLSQEFRIASNFAGPLNFSVGGNYLHYETEENYYVFINSLTLASYAWDHTLSNSPDQTLPWVPGVSDNSNCIVGGLVVADPNHHTDISGEGNAPCMYIDPNPLTKLNNQGHNYFLNQNPYTRPEPDRRVTLDR